MSVAALKVETKRQTAEEWLVQQFGESAKHLDGVSAWGTQTISGAHFVCDNYGRLFVTCGGTAIIALSREHTVDKRPMYIVADDAGAQIWNLRNQVGTLPLHESRPFPRLRLVFSA